MRGKGGARQTHSWVMPALDKALSKVANSVAAEPRKVRKPATSRITVPDEVIAEMRYLHEVERKPMSIIVRKYSQYSEAYVRQVLKYIIRVNIKPKASPSPQVITTELDGEQDRRSLNLED